MIREITDEEFDEVIGVDFSVVKFYADWCKPCKLLDPIIYELSNELTTVLLSDSASLCLRHKI